jgi:hypothetical protein
VGSLENGLWALFRDNPDLYATLFPSSAPSPQKKKKTMEELLKERAG